MLIFVFRHSPKTPFSLLHKHRKYRCFGSILRLQEKENIVNSVVLSLMGAENIVNYDVLGTFLNASLRTRQSGQAKNIVKYIVFCFFAILIFKFLFSRLLQKHRKYHGFGLVCGLPSFPICAGSRRAARARARQMSQYLGSCLARARARGAQQQQQQQQHHHHQQQQQHHHHHQHHQQQQQQQQRQQQQQQQQQPKTSYCHPTRTHTLFPGTAGGCVSSWISQIGWFPQVGLKIKNLWNHHLEE